MSDQKPVEQAPVVESAENMPVAQKPAETPAAANTNADAASKLEAPIKDEPAKPEEPTTGTATAGAPTTEATNSAEQTDEKPAHLSNIPSLGEFLDRLPHIVTNVGYNEMWGVSLKDSSDIPTVNVLIKFLRANEGNLEAAEEQLGRALAWRRDTKPLKLIESGRYSASKYGGLGYLTTYEQDGRPLVFTWNIYGAVNDVNSTFADSDE